MLRYRGAIRHRPRGFLPHRGRTVSCLTHVASDCHSLQPPEVPGCRRANTEIRATGLHLAAPPTEPIGAIMARMLAVLLLTSSWIAANGACQDRPVRDIYPDTWVATD